MAWPNGFLKQAAELASILTVALLLVLNLGVAKGQIEDLRDDQRFLRQAYERHTQEIMRLSSEIAALRAEIQAFRSSISAMK